MTLTEQIAVAAVKAGSNGITAGEVGTGAPQVKYAASKGLLKLKTRKVKGVVKPVVRKTPGRGRPSHVYVATAAAKKLV